MAFFKSKINSQTKKSEIENLIKLYNSTVELNDFPFSLAIQTFNNLKSTAENNDEFLNYLLEDIVFSSLYATYYEQILITVKDNPDVAIKLITVFEENTDERERQISEQTESHVQYLLNKGECKGCQDCQNHGDLDDLLQKWVAKDYNFFINLYLGMQTIQNAMEQLLYDFIIDNQAVASTLTLNNILLYRQFLYDDCQKRLS